MTNRYKTGEFPAIKHMTILVGTIEGLLVDADKLNLNDTEEKVIHDNLTEDITLQFTWASNLKSEYDPLLARNPDLIKRYSKVNERISGGYI